MLIAAIPSSLIVRRPDGWEAWCYIADDTDPDVDFKYSRRFEQIEAPTEQQLTAWADTLKTRVTEDLAEQEYQANLGEILQ